MDDKVWDRFPSTGTRTTPKVRIGPTWVRIMGMGKLGSIVMIIIGVIALLLGGLWVGQGSNLIKGSFMTGSTMWLVIGAIVFLVGVLLIIAGIDRGRKARRSS